jgi:hypothetical protein
MSSASLPDYGTPEYAAFQKDYIGSSPAEVAPRSIKNANEMDDCMKRLFMRQDYFRFQLGKVISILESPNCPIDKAPLRKKLFASWHGLNDTLKQARAVIKYTKKIVTAPGKIQHYKSLDKFLEQNLLKNGEST